MRHACEKLGFETTYLPVDHDGIVDVAQLAEVIRPDTILVSIMHANNEVGSIQPIEAISEVTRQHGVLLHTDAAQSVGKIPVHVDDLGVAALSIAGHKLYAPKGIGALYIRESVVAETLIHGASQEMGRRAGTENVLEITGLGKACELIHDALDSHHHHMKSLRDLLYDGLKDKLADVRLNGHPTDRLPNTLSISFKRLAANQILDAIGREVAASAGAACHSDTVMVSHVLQAMGIPLEWAKGTIRFSTGRMTTSDEIERAIQIITNCVKQLNA